MKTEALIFDMDGTMVDSMPAHAKSWVAFCRKHGIQMDAAEILARTTGRTGVECMAEVFGRPLAEAEALAFVHEKEQIYRELFAATFREVAGFTAFARQAAARGLKLAVGTAGDRHNIEFVMSRLGMEPPPLAIVGGDEGLLGQAHACHLPGSRAPHRRRARALHRVRGRALRHRGRAPWRHARRGRVQHAQRRRTRRPACDRGRAPLRRTRPIEISGDA